jgi:glycosyltransferase involved in cell wall biosynthesis
MPRFSVIVPNFNHGKYLEKRLDSILNQTVSDFELIIIDDGSGDNSRDIIEKYRSRSGVTNVIYNEENSGTPFGCWGQGLGLAQGDWIWIAESDDVADIKFLQEAEAAIKEYPNLGIFYSDSVEVNGLDVELGKFSTVKNQLFHSQKWSHSYHSGGVEEINQSLKFDCTINNVSAIVFKRAIFEKCINSINGFLYYGDWMMILNACLCGEVAFNNLPLNRYRRHSDSHLARETSILISRFEYFRILRFLCECKDVTDKKKVIRHFAYHYLSFGLLRDGITTGSRIVRKFFEQDRRLAWKVLKEITFIKLFRRRMGFPLIR